MNYTLNYRIIVPLFVISTMAAGTMAYIVLSGESEVQHGDKWSYDSGYEVDLINENLNRDPETINRVKNSIYLENETNKFVKAEKFYTLGILSNNQSKICKSVDYYVSAINDTENVDDSLIFKKLFFLQDDCDIGKLEETGSILNEVDGWKADFLKNMDNNTLRRTIEEKDYEQNLEEPEDYNSLVIGKSEIEVNDGDQVTSQVDRVSRDWLSGLFSQDPSTFPDEEKIIPFHEGGIVKEISRETEADFEIVTGTIVIKDNGRWFGPNNEGDFKYEVLPSKVIRPTSKCRGNVCLVTDTHGIASIATIDSDLVIGCGDHYGKMDAAVDLAKNGSDVFFPADRHVGEVLGHPGDGVLIGTAPVSEGKIGGQPVSISKNETITVQNIQGGYPEMYYDAPHRYFNNLQNLTNHEFDIEIVEVDEMHSTDKVLNHAKDVSSNVAGVRIYSEQDYEAVRNWLNQDRDNRVVLFHSSLYGYDQKIYENFPEQATFGDPQPEFS